MQEGILNLQYFLFLWSVFSFKKFFSILVAVLIAVVPLFLESSSDIKHEKVCGVEKDTQGVCKMLNRGWQLGAVQRA